MNRLELLEKSIEAIKAFKDEKTKIENVFNEQVFSDSSVYLPLGDSLVDSYIAAVSSILGDSKMWLDWYVYESYFGTSNAYQEIGDEDVHIDNAKKLLDLIDSSKSIGDTKYAGSNIREYGE
jgi:hypothetical protein